MSGFGIGERNWVEHLGNLRNVVRQEMIRRQLADHVRLPMAVLDVGCGQGTQAIELAALGCAVTGVEPSIELAELCRREADLRRAEVSVIRGSVDDLDAAVGEGMFDLVCAHGLLMYLEDRAAAIAVLGARVRSGGLLSVTCRNGDALAMRPGLRRDWQAALDGFDGDRYRNELGVHARADRIGDVTADLESCGFEVVDWYGVRVFNDAVSPDTAVPEGDELLALLEAEDRAGRQDPYRWVASQLHLVARRT